jgi:hypothetical protein
MQKEEWLRLKRILMLSLLDVDLFFKDTIYVQAFQITSLGVGAITEISSLETGCINVIFLACRWMLPSLLLLLKPYFKSPFIGKPINDN